MMSSAEMLTFIRHFSLIFGGLVSRENDFWQLAIQLRQIVELVVSQQININETSNMHRKISEYLQSLSLLVPGHLKPKHHFMLHYSRVFTVSGPLWNLSSMRFESKHREGKVVARSAISRVNVCRTIAIKHQLRQNYYFMKNEISPFTCTYHDVQEVSLRDVPDIICFTSILPHALQNIDAKALKVGKMIYEGVEFCSGNIIMVPSDDGPQFLVIHEIVLDNERNFMLIVKILTDVYFDSHMQAYGVLSNS